MEHPIIVIERLLHGEGGGVETWLASFGHQGGRKNVYFAYDFGSRLLILGLDPLYSRWITLLV